ncbi:MAG: hypothetical protein IT425_06895 [Pirellulales bacterium]|nr:hypothetical protein [Pirellulales bacterium]
MNHHPEIESSDEPIETSLAVLARGWATTDEISNAMTLRRSQRPLIGQLLLKHRKLTVHEVFEVLSEEAISERLFGQIAVDRGFLTAKDVGEMLYLQQCMCLPLWQVLLMQGSLTPAQADEVRQLTRDRLRKPLREEVTKCMA